METIGHYATDQYDSDPDDDMVSRCYYCNVPTAGEIVDQRRGTVYACEPCADNIRRGDSLTKAYNNYQDRE